jgi:predicted O-methyltransferase YrrM
MSNNKTLSSPTVSNTLNHLHKESKKDWKIMLRNFPMIFFNILKGKPLMQAITTKMAKEAFMPINKEQGELLYSLALASKAKNIVEFGSSFGVGTIYLASAAKDNGGKVISTEIETSKCKRALNNLNKAGLLEYATILEGDATKTLKGIKSPIDMVFLDGWKDLYIEVLDILTPNLKVGAIVVGDNVNLAEGKEYLAYVNNSDLFMTTVINNNTSVSVYLG